MRNPFENKSVKLNELSADQAAIVTAERRVNAAKRGLDETRRERAHVTEDAALFGKPADVAELRRLTAREAHYAELVATCERELADAKDAPARRAAEEKEAATNTRDMRALAAEIDSWAESGAALMVKADAMIAKVISVGMDQKSGYSTLKPAYRGIEVLLDKLRHFLGPNGADRIAEYRRIGVVSALKPAQPAAEKPTTLGIYVRSVPISRQARENAKIRFRMTPTGVETTTEPRL